MMPLEEEELAAPKEIVELVEKFERNYATCKDPSYKEAWVRTNYLDPLFKVLGWDVYGETVQDDAARDVVQEDSIEVEGHRRSPDYAFRLNSEREFFVEAKKPAVNLMTNADAARQIREYGWNANLPVSILTDFEEFVVYDCRTEPKPDDGPDTGLLLRLNYKEYIERWDDIANYFSKEAVSSGSLAKYQEAMKTFRGAKAVDKAILEDISRWREGLADDITHRNPSIGTDDLNIAVLLTINRILFLRMCEDRGMEIYGQLRSIAESEGIYPKLTEYFEYADDRYDSGLFHFKEERSRDRPDTFTPSLNVGDEALRDIIEDLYPPKPYNFAVIPPDILGQVYERCLGEIITLDEQGNAHLVLKPEVKKAGGVFYTPKYIVDYIIKTTVGKQVSGKSPNQVSEIKILDPACGSGSFLLGAYRFLLEWHLNWYTRRLAPLLKAGEPLDSPKIERLLPTEYKIQKPTRNGVPLHPIYLTATGAKLSVWEKKRILLNNIFGVDIDSQAVALSEFSLFAQVLEGETRESTQTTLPPRERALPDIDTNIKCGNSLVGYDFFDVHPDIQEEELRKVNPLDWERTFPNVMKTGGFHIVIGNPPYIRIQTLREVTPVQEDYLKKAYISTRKGNYDIYAVFVEKGLGLLNNYGRLGFILPHKFFNAKYGQPLRTLLSKGRHLSEIVHFGYQQVFSGATTYTCLLFLSKAASDNFRFTQVDNLDEWANTGSAEYSTLPASKAEEEDWIFAVGGKATLFDRLNDMPVKLKDVTSRIFQGIKTSADKIYILRELERESNRVKVYSKEKNAEYWIEPDLLHLLIKGGDSKRYRLSHTDLLILFPYAMQGDGIVKLIPEFVLETEYPLTYAYLKDNKNYLENRENGKMRGQMWYAYGRNQALDVISLPKIFTPDIAIRASFSLDSTGKIFFTGGAAGGYGILALSDYSPKFLLALLNSKLLEWFIHQSSTLMRGGYYSYESRFISKIPICTLDLTISKDKAKHDHIISLVDKMLDINNRLADAKTQHSGELMERQIEAINEQIDRFVYELYGLTEKEIEIVNNNVK